MLAAKTAAAHDKPAKAMGHEPAARRSVFAASRDRTSSAATTD